MPSSSATPLQDVETAEQTLTAWISTPGATPIWPPMMSATCVPWPPSQSISPSMSGLTSFSPQPIGSGSGARRPNGQTSPTKSKPPTMFVCALMRSQSGDALFAGSLVSAP